ncbi:TadE/TadG family type IV pilus assembly protein [Gimesia sp.]|uniref:TadE/TadG family type IV pilus assembly protein n=1 Tax=Gimesia sp. TaxID=2024833 RepID=UPI003A9194A4
MNHTENALRKNSKRRGIAAVESALVIPLLVMIAMGTIDVSQYVNVAQLVNDASYEGARRASQNNVFNQSEVEQAVLNYFSGQFPQMASSEIGSALTVNILDSLDASIPNGNLETIPSGSAVSVQVIFQFNSVRWLSGFAGLNGVSIETTTVMRRE